MSCLRYWTSLAAQGGTRVASTKLCLLALAPATLNVISHLDGPFSLILTAGRELKQTYRASRFMLIVSPMLLNTRAHVHHFTALSPKKHPTSASKCSCTVPSSLLLIIFSFLIFSLFFLFIRLFPPIA